MNLYFLCILWMFVCFEFLFLFTFIMCFECYCSIYVGVDTSTRRYEDSDIAWRSWEYIHKWTDYLNMLKEHIESYQQCHVYKDIQIEACFEIEKGEMNMQQNTKHAARKTQIDTQVEKKTCTHDIDSWRPANRQGMCVRWTQAIIGKAPRLGDSHSALQLGVSTAGGFEGNISGTQFYKIRWYAVWRMWMCGEWCERWVWGWVGRVWMGGKVSCSVMEWGFELSEVVCICVCSVRCLSLAANSFPAKSAKGHWPWQQAVGQR